MRSPTTFEHRWNLYRAPFHQRERRTGFDHRRDGAIAFRCLDARHEFPERSNFRRLSERSKVAVAFPFPTSSNSLKMLAHVQRGDTTEWWMVSCSNCLRTSNRQSVEVNQDMPARICGGRRQPEFSWQPIFTHVRNVFITQLLERHNIHCKAERPVRCLQHGSHTGCHCG